MLKKSKKRFLSCIIALLMITTVQFPIRVATAEENNLFNDFEDDTFGGFVASEENGTDVLHVDLSRDTSVKFSGDSSMKVEYAGVPENEDNKYKGEIRMALDDSTVVEPGGILSYKVYVPDTQTVNFQPFTLGGEEGTDWRALWVNSPVGEEKNNWFNIEYQIPEAAQQPIKTIGLQMMMKSDGAIWIDHMTYTPPVDKPESITHTLYDFEDGKTNFFVNGGEATLENVDNPVSSVGGKCLKVSYDSNNMIELRSEDVENVVEGSIITMDVYIPAGENVNFQPYIIPWKGDWNNGPTDDNKDKWVKIQLEIPSKVDGAIESFGTQLFPGEPGYIFIDNVNVEVLPVDKTALQLKLDEAQKLLDNAEEGEEIGQYKEGSKKALEDVIKAASVVNNAEVTTLSKVNEQIDNLNNAIKAFKDSINQLNSTINVSLKAIKDDTSICVKWDSIKSSTYTLLRSKKYGGPFEILAKDIKSNEFIDKTPNTGNNVYVVRVENNDGNVDYSEQVNTRVIGKYQSQDLILFSDKVVGGWNGGTGVLLDKETGWYPVDKTVKYNNLPSLHIKTTDSKGSWMGGIAPIGWNSMDLIPYIENGTLEFNVKGVNGGEDFALRLGCKTSKGGDGDVGTDKISKYVTVTKDWTHVSIPLKEFIYPQGDVLLNSFRQVLIKSGGNEEDIDVYLNDMRIITDDDELSRNSIKVNQDGYQVNSAKYAIVSDYANKFNVKEGTKFSIKDKNDKEVYSGTLKLLSKFDATSGDRVLKADFSDLKTEGEYYIDVDGVGKSGNFKISNEVYNSLLVDASKYYYYQRAGFALDEKYAGVFHRGAGIPQDSSVTLHSELGKPGAKKYDVSGGWYDAGDYGKYTSAASTAISELLWSYEMFKDEFKDSLANIPESGNKVSDLLDEVKFELDFILKMQDTTSGGFYSHVWDQNADMTPDKAVDMVRYIQDEDEKGNTNVRPTTHTADCVAALAQAYLVYKDIDPEYATTLLKAAKAGYEYLEKTPEFVGSHASQPYYDPDDQNDRLWAAASMFLATNEDKYNKYFLDHYKEFTSIFDEDENGHGWGNMDHTAFYTYFSSKNADKTALAWYRDEFNKWSDAVIKRAEENPWGNTLSSDGYVWGSNSTILDTAMDLYVGNYVLGNKLDRSINCIRTCMNYILGANPMALSYVSGHGYDTVRHSYSNIYSNDGIEEIPNGYLAGGANGNEGSGISHFQGKCYMDSPYEWTTNEHTIYWNSVLLFASASLIENPQVLDLSAPVEDDKEDPSIDKDDDEKDPSVDKEDDKNDPSVDKEDDKEEHGDMPETGSIINGTFYVVVGLILLGVAAVVIIKRRKNNNKEKA